MRETSTASATSPKQRFPHRSELNMRPYCARVRTETAFNAQFTIILPHRKVPDRPDPVRPVTPFATPFAKGMTDTAQALAAAAIPVASRTEHPAAEVSGLFFVALR